MSFHYDPITGERIEDGAEETAAEETAVAETEVSASGESASSETEAPAAAENEAPASGESVSGGTETTAAEETTPNGARITGYDPMTGQPVYAGAESAGSAPAQGQTITGYDPMTGQPIYGTQASGSANDAKPRKSHPGLWKKILIPVAAAAVVAVVVAICWPILAFGKNYKFVRAAMKSFDAGSFVNVLASPFRMRGDLGVSLNAEIDNYDLSVGAEFASDLSKGQYSLTAEVNFDKETLSAAAYMDGEQIFVEVPEVWSERFFYNYVDGSYADVNEMLQLFSGSGDSGNVVSDLAKEFLRAFNQLEFEKADPERFKIDGDRVSCKGYSAQINPDVIAELIENCSELLSEAYGDSDSEVVEEMFSDLDYLLQDVEYMPDDLYLDYFLYKGKIACLRLREDDYIGLSVECKGGNYWMENMIVEVDDGSYTIDISGSVKGNVENRRVLVSYSYYDWWRESRTTNEIEALSYTYNTKNGKLELTIVDSVTLEGKLKENGSGFVLTVEDISAGGARLSRVIDDFSLRLGITRKAKLHKVSSRNSTDLEDMDYRDFMDLEDDWNDYYEDVIEDYLDDYGYSIMYQLNDLEDLLEDIVYEFDL